MSQSIETTVDALDTQLRELGTPKRAAGEKRYLKSALVFYGVTVPAVRKLAKQLMAGQLAPASVPKAALLDLVRALWAPPQATGRKSSKAVGSGTETAVHERRSLAITLLEARVDDLQVKDLRFVESLLRECEGWAHIDWLSAHVAGSLVRRFASAKKALDRWAKDESFWLRRSALLALLVDLRAGGGDFEHFARLAEPMLDEREFFIRKTIGWVLRDTSKKRPELVEAFVHAHLPRLSRLTLREAIRHLPAATRDPLLAAHAAR